MARAVGLALVFLLLLGLLLTTGSTSAARESREERRRERAEQERGRGRGRGGEEEEEEEHGYPQIDLGKPRETLQTEGGRLRVWSEEIDAIRNSHVGIAELELEQDGLLLPQYTDADKIAYVLQGDGKMGAVIPGSQSEFRQTYIRQVQRGDVVALPKGTVYWWYNDGNERHRVLYAGDTNYGANPGHFHHFGLAGGKQAKFGSVLHGFSKETIATAWGADQKMIESLLERQNEGGIVKLKQRIRFPQIPEKRERGEEDEEQNTFSFRELKHSMRDELPDLYVKDGGSLTEVTGQKLPVLRQIGFCAVKVKLEKNAMMAPLFVRNGHQLFYFTRGSGRVQVVSGDGRNVLDQDVGEGTVIVVPQFFPAVKIAGEQGLEWIKLVTASSPSTTYLAGKNSVYNGIPKQVSAAAFNVNEEQIRELGRDEEVLFPPSSKRVGHGKTEMVPGSRREEGRNSGGKGSESEQQQRKRREEEEQQRRKRREEEEEERKRREQEEEERRRREEEQRRREEEEERRRHPREHEEEQQQRRQREEEEEEERRELPGWAMASLQML